MVITKQLAQHLSDVHFGGNWTTSNLKDTLTDITWQQAIYKVNGFNTIAALVYHINYYVSAVTQVLQGEPLNAKDALSFDHPPITSEQDWQRLLDKLWSDAKTFAALVEELPDSILEQNFADEKYGTYYRNLQGIIEHNHYHLGQVVILKKLVGNES